MSARSRRQDMERLDPQLILRVYGVTARKITIARGGTENTTYIVKAASRSYVLRIYRYHKKRTSQILAELNFMTYLAEHGFPVPKVQVNKSGNLVTEIEYGGVIRQCILMDFMDGEHIEILSGAQLIAMARVQAKMHVLGETYILNSSYHGQEPAQLIARLQVQSANYLIKIARRLMSVGAPLGVSHFDITNENLLFKKNRVSAILDFDDLNYAAIVDCLAATILRTNELITSEYNQTRYLTAYQQIRPLTAAELRRLQYLTSSRRQYLRAALARR